MGKIKRFLALLGVVLMVVLVVAAFILGITGSRYFMPMLYMAVFVPALVWVMLFVYRLIEGLSGNKQDTNQEDMHNKNM